MGIPRNFKDSWAKIQVVDTPIDLIFHNDPHGRMEATSELGIKESPDPGQLMLSSLYA